MAEQTAAVNPCIRELKRRNLIHFNLGPANGETGLPDRLVLLGHGRVIGLEFKDPKRGRLSAKQQWTREQWAKAGVQVHEIRSVGELRAILDVDCTGEEGARAVSSGRARDTEEKTEGDLRCASRIQRQ